MTEIISVILSAVFGGAVTLLVYRWDRSRPQPRVGIYVPPRPWVVQWRDRDEPSEAIIPMLPDIAALSGVEWIRDSEGVAWWPRREEGEYQWTRIGG